MADWLSDVNDINDVLTREELDVLTRLLDGPDNLSELDAPGSVISRCVDASWIALDSVDSVLTLYILRKGINVAIEQVIIDLYRDGKVTWTGEYRDGQRVYAATLGEA